MLQFPPTWSFKAAEPLSKRYTLSGSERLKSRKLIDELFRSARRFSNGPFRVSYSVSQGEGLLQFGIGAGTRNFKKAVDRNRIKRLCREAWRLSNAGLKDTLAQQRCSLAVFLTYTGRELPVYTDVLAGIEKIIANLTRSVNDKAGPAA